LQEKLKKTVFTKVTFITSLRLPIYKLTL